MPIGNINMIILAAALVVLTAISPVFANARVSEPYSVIYQKGYSNACRYGQMAEGSHTDVYVAGFNAGLQQCSNNNNYKNNQPD